MLASLLPFVLIAGNFAPVPPPIVRSFDDVRGQPYKVSYDQRSLLMDGKRVLLLGGTLQYPSMPPEEWRGVMQGMKDDGLNHLQMYTFWNVHEPTRGVYDFSDGSRANITRLLATAAEVGLFVNVRLGPYVCAEWNFGGLPVWLRDLPGIVFRDNNAVWKREMAAWLHRVAQELEPFLARNGGPVMMTQIENEYNSGWFGAWEPVEYVEWAGALATNLSLDVPTMMCNGLSANGTLNAYNGDRGGDQFAPSHAVNYPGQPLLWSEDEMGMSGWDGPGLPGPTAQTMARNFAEWIGLGAAHHNSYVWFGGNHVARWAGMAMTNAYADTAPMHSDRLPNEPLHSHVSRLHKVLAEHAPVILGSSMQQRRSLQRGRDTAELVPATVTARLGTIACDDGDAAQLLSLPAGGGALQAKVENADVCVSTVGAPWPNGGPPIGACDGSNSSQIFAFSDDAKGQGTLCSKSGVCLCATDPIRTIQGALGIPASKQTVGVSNASAAQSLDSCKWAKTGGRIMSMVKPPPPAPCTNSSMSFYLGLPDASSHISPGAGGRGNHTIAEATKICEARFMCAGFTYHASTNDTAIDCSAVHEILFQEVITNHFKMPIDKSWKVFAKNPIAYPYPDPRNPTGRKVQRCLTSGFASGGCGICDRRASDPCTCAYVYGSGTSAALAFVQNDGMTATNVSLPGSARLLSVAPNSISLVSGGITLFNTATVEGCLDPKSCSLPTVRQSITIAGNSSAGGSGVLSWRRWTEPALLSDAGMTAATRSHRPLEQLNVTQDRTDYLFYQREFCMHEAAANATLYIGTRHGSALSVFVNGKFTGANVDLQRPYSSTVTLPINIGALSAGSHNLTILAAAIGISNYPAHGTNGPHGQLPALGVTGAGELIVLETGSGSSNVSLTIANSSWSHLAGLAGERKKVFAGGSVAPAVWAGSSSVPGAHDTAPLSWFRTTFQVPPAMVASAAAANASILLDPAGMGRGHFYLNGADLGRFYPASPGAATATPHSAGLGGALYLPPSLLKGMNVLVLGEELGATQPTAVRVILSTLLSKKMPA